MIRGLELSVPHLCPPGEGRGLDVEYITKGQGTLLNIM